jgi:hypothetical protein
LTTEAIEETVSCSCSGSFRSRREADLEITSQLFLGALTSRHQMIIKVSAREMYIEEYAFVMQQKNNPTASERTENENIEITDNEKIKRYEKEK